MSNLFRFYVPEPLEAGKDYHLSEEESIHVLKVLRLEPGAELEIINGQGQLGHALLQGKSGKRAHIFLSHIRESEAGPEQRLTLAIAPTKMADRMEWLVEKAVELGVGRIIFLQTQRGERSKLRLDRLEKIALSALKQSKRLWLPLLQAPTPLKDLEFNRPTYVAWLPPDHTPPLLWQRWDPGQETMVLIGPEGDFSPEEIAFLEEKGAAPVSLGSARLRTETAGLQVVAAHLTARNG